MVRMWENTLLGIDKLTETQTGADVVTETQLDLKAGHIFGTVKKMSAASKYEVKIPNGVAGIRGTVYDISAEGVIKVLSGSVVLAYVGPDGSSLTQVIMGLQQFDARTGVLSALPDPDKTAMERYCQPDCGQGLAAGGHPGLAVDTDRSHVHLAALTQNAAGRSAEPLSFPKPEQPCVALVFLFTSSQ